MKYLEVMTREEKVAAIRAAGNDRELLNVLLNLQALSARSCLDGETIALLAEELSVSDGRIRECLSFYSMLNTEPAGRYVIEVCASAPCYLLHGEAVIKSLEAHLNIRLGETTADNLFTLRTTNCVGACDLGPVIKIGDTLYEKMTGEKACVLVDWLRKQAQEEGIE